MVVLRESRRIDSQRARRELAWPLRYPNVRAFLLTVPGGRERTSSPVTMM